MEVTMPKKRKRNYRKEYDSYHGTAKQRKNRSTRNKARRKLKLKVGDKREVDHKSLPKLLHRQFSVSNTQDLEFKDTGARLSS